MNLIEQLGGYENVSKHFNRIEYHAETKIFIGEWFGFYSMRDLKDALLQYRRQHNIFEVGDKVIFTDILNSCVVTFKSTETDPMQIVWLTYPDGTAGYVFHLSKIRHATDDEIKAGYRL